MSNEPCETIIQAEQLPTHDSFDFIYISVHYAPPYMGLFASKSKTLYYLICKCLSFLF